MPPQTLAVRESPKQQRTDFLTRPVGGIQPFAGVVSPPVPERPLSDTAQHTPGSLSLPPLRTRVRRQDRPGEAPVFYACHASSRGVSYGEGQLTPPAKMAAQEVFPLQEERAQAVVPKVPPVWLHRRPALEFPPQEERAQAVVLKVPTVWLHRRPALEFPPPAANHQTRHAVSRLEPRPPVRVGALPVEVDRHGSPARAPRGIAQRSRTGHFYVSTERDGWRRPVFDRRA